MSKPPPGGHAFALALVYDKLLSTLTYYASVASSSSLAGDAQEARSVALHWIAQLAVQLAVNLDAEATCLLSGCIRATATLSPAGAPPTFLASFQRWALETVRIIEKLLVGFRRLDKGRAPIGRPDVIRQYDVCSPLLDGKLRAARLLRRASPYPQSMVGAKLSPAEVALVSPLPRFQVPAVTQRALRRVAS